MLSVLRSLQTYKCIIVIFNQVLIRIKADWGLPTTKKSTEPFHFKSPLKLNLKLNQIYLVDLRLVLVSLNLTFNNTRFMSCALSLRWLAQFTYRLKENNRTKSSANSASTEICCK